MRPLDTVNFYATVTGASSGDVTWSASCGSIDSKSGSYQAPSSTGTCQVVATSTVDTSATGAATVVVSATGSAGLFNGGTFVLGVQGPDISAFATWAGRGMNAIVGPDEPGDGSGGGMANYVAAIHTYNTNAGHTVFHMMHSPRSGETAGGDVWAWEQTVQNGNDEPDAYGDLAANVAALQSQYTSWKGTQPNMPVWLNFSGTDYINGNSSATSYNSAIATGDWISFDLYPFASYNSWLNVNGTSVAGQASVIGYGLDKLRAQTTKPTLAYIQVGPTSSTDGTVGQIDVRNQMWNAVIHGARGILIWTANTSNGFKDDTPAANGTEIGANASWINSLSDVLSDQIIAPVTLGPADAIGIGTIHVGGRSTAAGKYYIVQNVSKTASWTGSIPLAGVGSATGATIHTMPSGWPTTTTAVTSTCTNCISSGSIASQTLAAGAVVIYEVQ